MEPNKKVEEGQKPAGFSKQYDSEVDEGFYYFMTGNDTKVYKYLQRHADLKTLQCWRSVERISKETGVFRKGVQKSSEILDLLGLIKKAKIKIGPRWSRCVYTIIKDPKLPDTLKGYLQPLRNSDTLKGQKRPLRCAVEMLLKKRKEEYRRHLKGRFMSNTLKGQNSPYIETIEKEREEGEEREESSSPSPLNKSGSAPPPFTHLDEIQKEDKTQDVKTITGEVSSSLSKIPRTPVSPFFEKGHKRRIETGEKAFDELKEDISTNLKDESSESSSLEWPEDTDSPVNDDEGPLPEDSSEEEKPPWEKPWDRDGETEEESYRPHDRDQFLSILREFSESYPYPFDEVKDGQPFDYCVDTWPMVDPIRQLERKIEYWMKHPGALTSKRKEPRDQLLEFFKKEAEYLVGGTKK